MIKNMITEWVKENYGQDELENPSWDIDLLAKHIESKTKQMNDELYKQVYKAMCDTWAVLDSLSNPDYEAEYKQLDKAIDNLYFWYNKK